MNKARLPLFWLGCWLISPLSSAQTVIRNATIQSIGSDNTGDPLVQPGTEVLMSMPGGGVRLAPESSYEHVGQFYVAGNGIWNFVNGQAFTLTGTDYFGYAPADKGAVTAYLGRGIMGASPFNGGNGIGRPTFGHLQLNSTGEFPVQGGMLITQSLRFNANGPGASNRITTPACTDALFSQQAVVFTPSAQIAGANHQNYIDGYASVTGVQSALSLPIGDMAAAPFSLRPLTILSPTAGTVTARYSHRLDLSTQALPEGIGSISSVGSWAFTAPAGTEVAVSLPILNLSPADGPTLRLLGWTGADWIVLSRQAPTEPYAGEGYVLTGTVALNVSRLAIGSVKSMVFTNAKRVELQLTVWPNPTQRTLTLSIPAGESIRQVQVLDMKGRLVLNRAVKTESLDVHALPGGTYLVEVTTGEGHTLRQRFIKQD